MTTFQIKVTDQRGKYQPRVYSIKAESELEAYGDATKQFIKDNNHPAYKPGTRISSYYSRFWNEVVK